MKAWSSKIILISAVTALLLAGCGGNNDGIKNGNIESEGSGKKLKVVTSFYPMYEFSKQVAGEHADVISLIPAGVEPHDWEPSAKDMANIKEADLFVYNGIVEGWAEQALESAPNDKRVVVEASGGVQLMEGVEHEEEGHEEEEHEEEGHGLDPHIWLSPVLAQREVLAIQEAFMKADPEHKDDYKANADAYMAKLKELDDAFKSGLQGIKHTEFVTQHAAFGYLAKEYGLTQVPIAGLSPEQEPSPEQMAEVVAFAKEREIKTILFETLVDPKIAQTIADEIGAKTDVLNPIEGLTEEEKKDNLDYIGIMAKNLEALKKALNE
ncbi:metal ABC transporter substrate-binding protein [Paenibacillus sp. Soil522]|uniref:metal ABC transporter substrate-binding protein n=1 Tax=Paenibacillus sp. Soil522 TaxID=1736388 RepID=UPI0006F9CF4E|nr:metal ABC transporter substrate-binding protein [Paenibacillus sp. Soil522]KRE48990.1 zinc ABC transporter substrate-binding protein [Paenibacillus sp. Soil522]